MSFTYSIRNMLLFVAIVSLGIVFHQAAGWIAMGLMIVGVGLLYRRRKFIGFHRTAVTVLALLCFWMGAVDLVGRQYTCGDVGCDERYGILEVRVLTFPVWKYESQNQQWMKDDDRRVLGYRFRLHGFLLPNPDLKLPPPGIQTLV